MKPTPVVSMIHGEPRRICDVLSSTPWAVRSHPGPKSRGFASFTASEIAGFNLETATRLVKERTTVVFADEVANDLRWSFAVATAAWKETPGVMPPFDCMMVEARTGADKVGHDCIGIGIEATTVAANANEPVISFVEKYVSKSRQPDVRAVVRAFVWLQRADGSIWGPVAEIAFPIDTKYSVMLCVEPTDWLGPSADSRAVGMPMVTVLPYSTLPGNVGKDAELVANAIHLAGVVFIRTCGMMNASNIKLVEGGRTNSEFSERARAEKRLGHVKYNVLRLKVGTRLVPLPTRNPDATRPDPMHIVRGHFKDFSKKGLFGKYAGEKYSHVWCPSFVRGDAADGVIVKDYEQSATSPTA